MKDSQKLGVKKGPGFKPRGGGGKFAKKGKGKGAGGAEEGSSRKNWMKVKFTRRKKHKPNFKQRQKLKALREAGITPAESPPSNAHTAKAEASKRALKKRRESAESSDQPHDGGGANDHEGARGPDDPASKRPKVVHKEKPTTKVVTAKVVKKERPTTKVITAKVVKKEKPAGAKKDIGTAARSGGGAPQKVSKSPALKGGPKAPKGGSSSLNPPAADGKAKFIGSLAASSTGDGKLTGLKQLLMQKFAGHVLEEQPPAFDEEADSESEMVQADSAAPAEAHTAQPHAAVKLTTPVSTNWLALSQQMKQGAKAAKKASKEAPAEGASQAAGLPRGGHRDSTKPGRILPPPDANLSAYAAPMAIDCEMVGVGDDGKRSMLARVSIVDVHGEVVIDTFVAPMEKVTDYRTAVSGIRPESLRGATDFSVVQQLVSKITDGKVLVGHSISNDLKALLLSHPRQLIRDTATYRPFQRLVGNKQRARKLRDLTKEVLGLEIQAGEHSSVDDARATLLLYKQAAAAWEKEALKAAKAGGKVSGSAAGAGKTVGGKGLGGKGMGGKEAKLGRPGGKAKQDGTGV